MQNTGNDDTAQSSIDDVIMDFLFKKGITDQTEKMAISRISNKTEISGEQVEASLKRLSVKNLIRKIYSQGRVGFELTPRGRLAIDALAKAQTIRITQQLQEAISQQRKAKLRLSAVNKIKAVEEEWQNCQIPDKKLIDKIEQDTKEFLSTTKEIESKQPFCHIDPQNYERLFSLYKPQIENLAEQNSNLIRAVNNYAKTKNYQLSISSDIENVTKAISRYESVPESAAQVSQLKTFLINLKLIQSQLDIFDQNQLSRFEELKTQLGNNFRLLELLKKPTHEFTSIRRENLTAQPNGEPDPECPIKYASKTSGYSSVEKCSKCGTKRKPTPFDIG
jgi:hypothetical protein